MYENEERVNDLRAMNLKRIIILSVVFPAVILVLILIGAFVVSMINPGEGPANETNLSNTPSEDEDLTYELNLTSEENNLEGENNSSSSTGSLGGGTGGDRSSGGGATPTTPCTSNLVNSSWREWVNLTECVDAVINQSRNLTQYDLAACLENETFFENRLADCDSGVCVPTKTSCGLNECGLIDNGCEVDIDCGGCNSEESCVSNVCVVDPFCGDGTTGSGEACDDGDAISGDGCSSACAVESGYSCLGSPSVCSEISIDCDNSNILCVDDTPGEFQEYSTIQSAMLAANPGDLVLVMDGNYGAINVDGQMPAFTGDTSQKLNVLESEYVHVTAYPGARPVIGNWNFNAINIDDDGNDFREAYYIFEGFEIRGPISLLGVVGFKLRNSYLIADNNNHIFNNGISIGDGGSNIEIFNCTIEYFLYGATLKGNWINFTGNDVFAQGQDALQIGGYDLFILDNDIHDNQRLTLEEWEIKEPGENYNVHADGIQVWNPNGVTRLTFSGNRLYNLDNSQGFFSKGYAGDDVHDSLLENNIIIGDAAIRLYQTFNTIIRNNIVSAIEFPYESDLPLNQNISIYNNIILGGIALEYINSGVFIYTGHNIGASPTNLGEDSYVLTQTGILNLFENQDIFAGLISCSGDNCPIDTGINSAQYPASNYDIKGNLRDDGYADIGAYEYVERIGGTSLEAKEESSNFFIKVFSAIGNFAKNVAVAIVDVFTRERDGETLKTEKGLESEAEENRGEGTIEETQNNEDILFNETQEQLINETIIENETFLENNTLESNETIIENETQVDNETEFLLSVPLDYVGYWNFDEGFEGSLLGDAVYSGEALQLDGDGDYADLGNSPKFSFNESFSIGAWIYKSGNSINTFGKTGTVLGKEILSNTGYGLEVHDESKDDYPLYVRCFIPGVSFSGKTTFYSKSPIEMNKWHHVFCTYDGEFATIYVDGFEDSKSSTTGSILVGDDSLKIGYSKGSGNSNNYWNGSIDEVMIYNRALSSLEVNSIYCGQRGICN